MRQQQANKASTGSGEQGAASVEFAIILPVLILMIFGIIQFGIAFNRVQGLQAAAREGARAASLPHITKTDVEDRIRGALDGVLANPADVDISVTPSDSRPCNLRTGDTVVVEVEYPHKIDIPLWGTQEVTLHGRGEFRCE
jgi:Flp pilus assembly protein TadG